MKRQRRREFLRTVAGATAATALSSSRIPGATNRIRLGLIGCGSRSVGDMDNFVKLGDVDVTALCDVYGTHVDRAKKTAPTAKTFKDHYKDGRTAPDTINVLLEYPSQFTATFEATLAPGISGSAIEFCGTEGRLWISRARYEYYEKTADAPGAAARPPTIVQASGSLDRDHMQNFVDCVRSRKLPNGDVLIGHRSAQASHLGNLAYLQKRRIAFDPAREQMLPS